MNNYAQDLDARIDNLEADLKELESDAEYIRAQILNCKALKNRQEIVGFLTQLTLGFEFTVSSDFGDEVYKFSGYSWVNDSFSWESDAPIKESTFIFLDSNDYISFHPEFYADNVWHGEYRITRKGIEYLNELQS